MTPSAYILYLNGVREGHVYDIVKSTDSYCRVPGLRWRTLQGSPRRICKDGELFESESGRNTYTSRKTSISITNPGRYDYCCSLPLKFRHENGRDRSHPAPWCSRNVWRPCSWPRSQTVSIARYIELAC